MSSSISTLEINPLIEKLKANCVEPFVVQIGAMDGERFDLLHPHLIQGGRHGIFVEPVPEMFELLKQTYKDQPNFEFVCSAITRKSGTITLRYVDPKAIEDGIIPSEAVGISSCAPSGGVLGSEGFSKAFPEVVEKHILSIEVKAETLPELLARHEVVDVDFFMIDTEGSDWIIAKQIDLDTYNPSLICIEHVHLNDRDKFACISHFTNAGYEMHACSEDPENILFTKDI